MFARALVSKEVSQYNRAVVVNDIFYFGAKRFICKSDDEPAMRALKSAVIRDLGLDYEAKPEETPVGDHQANGDIENGIKEIEKRIRVIKDATESKLGLQIDDNHPILSWLPHHAAFLVSRFAVAKDGRTAYERSRGKPYRRELAPWAEKVHYTFPKGDR